MPTIEESLERAAKRRRPYLLLIAAALLGGCAAVAPDGALMPGDRHVALFGKDRVLAVDPAGRPAWVCSPGIDEAWGGTRFAGTAEPRVGEAVVLCTIWGPVEGTLVSVEGARSLVRFDGDWLVREQIGAPVRPAGEPGVCLGVLTGISSKDARLGLIERPGTGPVVARGPVGGAARSKAAEMAWTGETTRVEAVASVVASAKGAGR